MGWLFVKCVQFVNRFFGTQNWFIYWTNREHRVKIYPWGLHLGYLCAFLRQAIGESKR